ncbi:MAG: type II toxin-antitoxin system VapC family toxin [Deltaproteobacteria bacterium]|nr:type II toxin-antitoxin system VapC family toxin [Deltaproteobacteria bacterium]
MKVLVDTSVLVDHLRGDERAVDFLLGAVRRGDELWSVTVVRTEILAGMRRGEELSTRRLLGRIRWLDVTAEVADTAGSLARRFLRSHPGIDTVDYLVAAAARLTDADLATLNVKHFPMFPDLEPAYR